METFRLIIKFLLSIIDRKVAVDVIIDFLEVQAEKTNTKLDDKLVALLKIHKEKLKGE